MDNNQALMNAAINSNNNSGYNDVMHLTNAWANINYQNKNGTTILMAACMHANASIVDALLLMGVDINVQNTNGQTALMIALQFSDFETIVRLINHGASDNIMDNEGRNVIDYYAQYYNRIHSEHFIQGLDNEYIMDNLNPFNNIIILQELNHLINNQIVDNQDDDDDNQDDDNQDDDDDDDDDNQIIINQIPDLINIP